jgi:hypothetical protein
MLVSVPAVNMYFIIVLLVGMTVLWWDQSTVEHFFRRLDQSLSLAKLLAKDNDSRGLRYQSPQAGPSR